MKKNTSFLKSLKGKIVIVSIIVFVIVFSMQYSFSRKDKLKEQLNQTIAEPLETIYIGTLSKISPDKQKPETEPEPEPPQKADNKTAPSQFQPPRRPPSNNWSSSVAFSPGNRRNKYRNTAIKPYTPPIGLYTAKPSSIPPNQKRQSAPYGQLLRCELTQTVMTSNLQTPIIAMVTEPLWWNGREIIPAGVIVHGVAASSPMRDRVGTGKKWVLVWPHRNEWNGKKLVLNAIALACDRTEKNWSKIDGSAGIKGDVISNEDQKRMYAYMASFISGLGEGMVSENEDITGSTTTKSTGGTFNDALGKAFQQSASDISDQLFKELSQNMFYVEARAGTEFYLYITQDIRISEAKKGQLITQTKRRKRK